MPAPDHLLVAKRVFLATLFRDGERPWGWKAVDHEAADLDFIAQLFPEAAQVLVVRDLRTVYPSLVTRGWDRWRPGGADAIAQKWTERSLAYLGRTDRERTMLVRFEDLRHRLPALIALIDGDAERAAAELDFAVSSTPGASLDKSARERIERIARPALAALGYPSDAFG